jgi:hypothetical protein
MIRLTQAEALDIANGDKVVKGDLVINSFDGLPLDISGLNLSNLSLWSEDFRNSNLRHVDFTGSDLRYTKFSSADLSYANFTNAELSGADLSGAKLEGVIGLASKEEEMAEAKRILRILENPANSLDMSDWHRCKTTHCLAGWSCPNEEHPGAEASRKMPTLAKYFYEDDEREAYAALERVASGQESIWNTLEGE